MTFTDFHKLNIYFANKLILIIMATRVEKLEPLVIGEDTAVGTLLATVIASDPDYNSDLR